MKKLIILIIMVLASWTACCHKTDENAPNLYSDKLSPVAAHRVGGILGIYGFEVYRYSEQDRTCFIVYGLNEGNVSISCINEGDKHDN